MRDLKMYRQAEEGYALLGQEELVELPDGVLWVLDRVANRPAVREDLIVVAALKGLF